MSHSLNFYVKPVIGKFDSEETKKEKENTKPLFLMYYPGSSEVYQRFRDNNIQCYCGDNDDIKELTIDNINDVLFDIKSDIKKVESRIKIIKECNNPSIEILEDLVSSNNYLEDLEEEYKEIEFISNLRKKLDWYGNKLMFNND